MHQQGGRVQALPIPWSLLVWPPTSQQSRSPLEELGHCPTGVAGATPNLKTVQETWADPQVPYSRPKNTWKGQVVERTSKHWLGRVWSTCELTLFQLTHLGLEAYPNKGKWAADWQVPHKEAFARQSDQVVSSRRIPSVAEGLGVLLTLLQTHGAKH